MPRPRELDIDLANDDADGIADNNDSSGTSLTLDGALTSGGTYTAGDVGCGRIIEIKDASTSDQSGATFTITGTNQDDVAITDAVTGPGSGATVKSAKAFKTISSIAIASGVGSATVDVGPANETLSGIGPTFPLNFYSDEAATISVDVTGTINFTVQETFDDVLGTDSTGAVWTDITAFADKTADTTSTATKHARGIRIEINSYSNGAELQAVILQN